MRRAVLLALVVLAAPAPQAQDFFAIRKNFELFGRIYETLAAEYVDPVDAERILRTGIAAMTGTLDPYTVYFNEGQTAAGRLQQGGEVGGVGLAVEPRGGQLTVVAVAEASAGEAQGVRAGDAVVTIAGRDASGLTTQTAQGLLSGEPGSTVEVVVEREGEPEPLRFVLVRAEEAGGEVPFSGFVGDPDDAVGYVRLARFLGDDPSGKVADAVERLQAERPLEALVLDLRGNPGGLLNEAVELSGQFLPQGTLVTATRGRAEGTDATYRTETPPTLPDLPVAVLIDRHSASASEIVSGALQDHDRAVIVGETSLGKGLVQIVRPMPYGTALKLTVSRYTTPSGREIQKLDYHQGERAAAVPDSLRRTFRTTAGRPVRSGGGIEPDVAVELGSESDLEAALTRTAAFLRFANRYRAEHPALPPTFRADDRLLADFRRFVEAEGIVYQTEPERQADALAEALAADGYSATGELSALRRAVEREKARDVERHAPRLKARLRQEILSRYVGGAGLSSALLADDPVLDAALTVLKDRQRYDRLLGR